TRPQLRPPQEGGVLARAVARSTRAPGAARHHQPMNARVAVFGLVWWSGAAAPGVAQSIAARVAAAPDGDVRLSYAARPGVLGNGRNTIQWNCRHGHCQSQVDGDWSDGDDWRNVCDSGPVRVALRVRGGAITDVRVAVGGQWIPR